MSKIWTTLMEYNEPHLTPSMLRWQVKDCILSLEPKISLVYSSLTLQAQMVEALQSNNFPSTLTMEEDTSLLLPQSYLPTNTISLFKIFFIESWRNWSGWIYTIPNQTSPPLCKTPTACLSRNHPPTECARRPACGSAPAPPDKTRNISSTPSFPLRSN